MSESIKTDLQKCFKWWRIQIVYYSSSANFYENVPELSEKTTIIVVTCRKSDPGKTLNVWLYSAQTLFPKKLSSHHLNPRLDSPLNFSIVINICAYVKGYNGHFTTAAKVASVKYVLVYFGRRGRNLSLKWCQNNEFTALHIIIKVDLK